MNSVTFENHQPTVKAIDIKKFAQRPYVVNYPVVSYQEALERLNKRIKGELPLIENGLDFFDLDVSDIEKNSAGAKHHLENKPANSANASESDKSASFDSFDQPIGENKSKDISKEAQAYTQYISRRSSAVMYLTEGAIALPVVEAQVTKYSINLIIYKTKNSVLFIPKFGSNLEIGLQNENYPCLYLGAHTVIEPLNLIVLSFVRASEIFDKKVENALLPKNNGN